MLPSVTVISEKFLKKYIFAVITVKLLKLFFFLGYTRKKEVFYEEQRCVSEAAYKLQG